jgi:hypothetical protein
MRTRTDLFKHLTMMVATLAFALSACDDDDKPAGDTGQDVTGDVQPDTQPDVDPDAQPDVQPDVEGDPQPDVQLETGEDVIEDTNGGPENMCLGDVAALTANGGALQSDILGAVNACAQSISHCLLCAVSDPPNPSLCGGVADTESPNYVDCADTSTPDEECTPTACVARCIAENNFGSCADEACGEGETCDDDDICRSDDATAVNDSSVSDGCVDCFIGIVACVLSSGCIGACLSDNCSCFECQCDVGCVDGFETCSGLPGAVDCTVLPANPGDCVDEDGEPNGTCNDTTTISYCRSEE